MTLVRLELRVRDWYVPHPLFMSLQIGYLKLEEIFKESKKNVWLSTINPIMTLVKLELRVKRLVCSPPFVHVTSNRLFKT